MKKKSLTGTINTAFFGIVFFCLGLAGFGQPGPQKPDISFILQYTDSLNKIANNGIFYVGDHINGKLRFNSTSTDAQKYVYILTYNESSPDFFLLFPDREDENKTNRLPYLNSSGKQVKEINLFEAEISYPLGIDNIVVVLTDNPIRNYADVFNFNNNSIPSRGSFRPDRQELLKFLKGSKLSTYYHEEYGDVFVKSLQFETRPTEEKKGLLKSEAGTIRSGPKQTKFIFEDASGVSEIFYTPSPQEDITRDDFPTIDIIDPSFDTAVLRGMKTLAKTETKKIQIRGIVADRKHGIKKITLNEQAPSTFREASGFFDYLYELKKGPNVIDITVENNDGFIRTLKLKFRYDGPTETVTRVGNDYLLVVGIDHYKSWPPLNNPKFDALAFKKVMIENYGFKSQNVIELFDEKATRDNVSGQLLKLVDNLTENDRLLIYYAGHGYYHEKLELGYWIPVNAKDSTIPEYVSNLDIARYIQKMKAKNIFVIADACYSGSLLRDMRNESNKDYRSRMILCAGKLKPVKDGKAGQHSPFASKVLEYFQTNKDKDVLLASDLIQYVTSELKKEPVGGAIDEVGDENGDFIFQKKKQQ